MVRQPMHFEMLLCQELIISNKAVGVEAESTHADNYIWREYFPMLDVLLL